MSAVYRHMEEEERGAARKARPGSHKKPRSSSAKALVAGAAAPLRAPLTPAPLARPRAPALVRQPGVPGMSAGPKKPSFWNGLFKKSPSKPAAPGKPKPTSPWVVIGLLALITIVLIAIVVPVVITSSSSSSSSTVLGVTEESSSSGVAAFLSSSQQAAALSSSSSSAAGGGVGAGGASALSGFTPLVFRPSFTAGNVYFIALASNTNLCLQIANTSGHAYRSGAFGASIDTCNPTPWSLNQQWYYPSTTRLWLNDASGVDRYLSSSDQVTCTSGTPLMQLTSTANEATAAATTGNGFFYNTQNQGLIASSCNTCVDASDGFNVTLQACSGLAAQRWLWGVFSTPSSSSSSSAGGGGGGNSGPASYDATVLADAPFLYWPLNETGGTLVHDYSGNAQMGVMANGFTYGAAVPPCCPGAGGAALTWTSGLSSFVYAQTTQSNPALPFSMEVWLAPTGTGGSPYMIADLGSQSAGSGNNFDNVMFTVNSVGNLYGGSWGNNGSGYALSVNGKATPFRLYNGNCHHMVVTFESSGRIDIYLDGYLFVRSGGASTRNTGLTGVAWRLGAPEAAIGETFYQGVISNFAVYPTLLSDVRVLAHYQAAPTSTCPNWALSSSTGGG